MSNGSSPVAMMTTGRPCPGMNVVSLEHASPHRIRGSTERARLAAADSTAICGPCVPVPALLLRSRRRGGHAAAPKYSSERNRTRKAGARCIAKPARRWIAALYVVATPIGNLRDLTLRALDVLKAVDLVAAEDTRVTRHLLAALRRSTRTRSALHEHNEERGCGADHRDCCAQGKSVALVSDAGTPAISDPGRAAGAARAASGLASRADPRSRVP